MKIVALEEHFATEEVSEAWGAVDGQWRDDALKPPRGSELAGRLLDFTDARLRAMEEAGIDVAVLSLTTPGVQNLEPQQAVKLARSSNDRLAAAVKLHPDRLQGFATLPTPDAHAAAQELERAVRELGLQGAMLHGRTRDRHLSDAEFWPIFEAADALRAPLYLHPQSPQAGAIDALYSGLGKDVDVLLARPGIGWHYEAGIEILRLVLAGVFDRYPNLQIITGHWGEVVLFYLDRIDLLSGVAKLPRKVSEYVAQHLYVTPSGVFSQRYLRWAMEVLGADHILFATDYPYARIGLGAAKAFLATAELSEVDRNKIGSGNWERMCAGIQR